MNNNKSPKFQVNGLFEVPANNMDECLEKIKQSGLNPISINIYEVKIMDKEPK